MFQFTSKIYFVRPTSHLVQTILQYNAVEAGVWNLSADVVPPASREAILGREIAEEQIEVGRGGVKLS